MAIELLIDVLDIARILADQHGSEIFDRSGYRPGLPLERCLSPAKRPAWSVMTLTNIQFRISALTTMVLHR
jgi:hypothetical protein